MKKELKNIQIVVLVIASILYLGLKALPFSNSHASGDEYAYVERAVDGDTLKLSDGRRVRLIGLDTPEWHYSGKLLRDSKRSHKDIKAIQELGREAAQFTKALCEGKSVRLETDVEKRDKYGRTLAYVYLEDGTFVNARIIEEGYAKIMTIPPNVKYAKSFLELQKKARDENKGLWRRDGGL